MGLVCVAVVAVVAVAVVAVVVAVVAVIVAVVACSRCDNGKLLPHFPAKLRGRIQAQPLLTLLQPTPVLQPTSSITLPQLHIVMSGTTHSLIFIHSYNHTASDGHVYIIDG